MMISSANGNFEMKNIKEFCKDWKTSIKDRMSGQRATLYIIQVGDNEASTRYVRNKVKDALEVGIQAEVINLPEDISQMMVEQTIMDIVDASTLNPAGIIVQLPLPAHLDKDRLAELIPFRMDVDGFKNGTPYHACTPLGIITYLKACNFKFEGAHVVVIGRSDIVGKPVAQMLTDLDATVTLCHSKTKNLHTFLATADLIVCAVGKAKFLNCYPIHVSVIDVGINFDENGKMCGDCFNTDNRLVTPVPGGVGLLTRCALMENMVTSKEYFEHPTLDGVAQIPVRLGD